ncbi:MPI phosphatase family protein [Abortiporus biennis]
MGLFSTSSKSSSNNNNHHTFLNVPGAPSRKPNQRLSGRATAEYDDFLSSDLDAGLEASFASTMSINSPTSDNIALTPEDVDMGSPPAPCRPQTSSFSAAKNPFADSSTTKPKIGRPRAFTSGGRLFGMDKSNSFNDISADFPPALKSGSGTAGTNKKLQRAALPMEWMFNDRSERENLFAQPQHIPSSPSDAMDVDTSYIPSPAPLSAAPTITAFNVDSRARISAGPLSAAPTISTFNNLFFNNMSPNRDRAQGGRQDYQDSPSGFVSIDESPVQPFPKKRRSVSPEHSGSLRRAHNHLLDEPSSPALLSSPSAHKLERIASGPLLANYKKPTLSGLGAPLTLNVNNKRPRRPVLSALVAPGDGPVPPSATQSAFPHEEKENDDGRQIKSAVPRHVLPPVRRAFSAMLPPTLLEQSMSSEDGSSFDHESADMSSPAQAYAKRQQVKTIRRCDGTDDFRPLTGATALVHRDQEARQKGLRRSEERMDRPTERDTPRSKYLNGGGSGLGGFGDNEAHGKILPCHRVREDGLMRINCKTLGDLLDGKYNREISSYHIIDCRFDYEYNGGHILGAININTTSGVEDFLLGHSVEKPLPSTSGDDSRKTVLIFHCEFSAKRAPTFAKHLRSKDRSMNNHVYPRIHYPEVYILEGGYCRFYQECGQRCEPNGYVQMDDPLFATSRREDLDQFRKGKFGRTKSYAYGESKLGFSSQMSKEPKRNTAPAAGGSTALFAAANAARTRRTNGMLQTLDEDSSGAHHSDDDETDIGDSPCPPPTKGVAFKGKKMGRAPLARAETYGPSRMTMGF